MVGFVMNVTYYYYTVNSTIAKAVEDGLKPAYDSNQVQIVTYIYDEFYLPKSISKCQ